VKSFFVVALSALALSGCSLSQERPDLAALIRALQGDATYKETCLLINRTSHDLLVGQNAYLVKDCGSGSTQSRTVREGESLGDVIAELDGQVQNRSGAFFLVRGIGKKTEKIFYGLATLSAAGSLRPTAGDLLVIDPPPGHLLFKEYEQTR